MRQGTIVVTGATGRLGSALIALLAASGADARARGRPTYDLDEPAAAGRLLERDRPGLVMHTAAWTDVDGCALQPDLAHRRNAVAVDELAQACAATGSDLVLISTNEVFDGKRGDGAGYREDDPRSPLNPYGASKLAGEMAARARFEQPGVESGLWIVRTAWLFGPPLGRDFPSRILGAADARHIAGEPLRVVADETGSPTYAPDAAEALLSLLERAPPGTYHLVNAGRATRAEWATRVLAACRDDPPEVVPITQAEFPRPSHPPAWAVLDASRAASFGIRLRDWTEAFDAYAPELRSAELPSP